MNIWLKCKCFYLQPSRRVYLPSVKSSYRIPSRQAFIKFRTTRQCTYFAIGLVVNIVISEHQQRRKKALGDRLRVTKISNKYKQLA